MDVALGIIEIGDRYQFPSVFSTYLWQNGAASPSLIALFEMNNYRSSDNRIFAVEIEIVVEKRALFHGLAFEGSVLARQITYFVLVDRAYTGWRNEACVEPMWIEMSPDRIVITRESCNNVAWWSSG